MGKFSHERLEGSPDLGADRPQFQASSSLRHMGTGHGTIALSSSPSLETPARVSIPTAANLTAARLRQELHAARDPAANSGPVEIDLSYGGLIKFLNEQMSRQTRTEAEQGELQEVLAELLDYIMRGPFSNDDIETLRAKIERLK